MILHADMHVRVCVVVMVAVCAWYVRIVVTQIGSLGTLLHVK